MFRHFHLSDVWRVNITFTTRAAFQHPRGLWGEPEADILGMDK